MNRDVVLRFVCMPMAAALFRQDKNKFSVSKVNVVYYDLIDSVLEKLDIDFKQLKADMYSKYHLDVKYLGKNNGIVRYSVNKEIVEYTPDELKDKTEELMKEYLGNVKLKSSEGDWG